MANKWFFCARWRQQITEEVCLRRFKKGLKKCKGCEKGEALGREAVNRRDGEGVNR